MQPSPAWSPDAQRERRPFVNLHQLFATWATSPTGETTRLERVQSEFESPVAYHFVRINGENNAEKNRDLKWTASIKVMR